MHELVLSAGADVVEPLSDALMDELDALSVSVEDADVDTDAELALFGEPDQPAPGAGWQHSTLRALFADEAKATTAATLLLAQDWAAEVRLRALRAVPVQDWVRLTQAQFAPVEITPTFWVVPSWHQAPASAQRVIRLDPGMAFGTGTHPTTRMCLRWIAGHAQAWPRVLDYGCGSGILAIAAALHGAQQTDAFDVDPAAIATTQVNASTNRVMVRTAAPGHGCGRYELVLANILAKPLVLLAPLLSAHVAAGGHLVLAGILERQLDELRLAYGPWLALEVHDREDGWVLLVGRRVDARARAMP
jgi:ribosomal protein L11 methyltransferase